MLIRTHAKQGVYLKGGAYWKEGAKLIIMVHLAGQYMNFTIASENIDEGRKSNLATPNTM